MSRRAKVLFGDMDNISVQITTYTLEHEGFEIVKARSGLEALRLAREKHIDIILLEADLPDVGGTALCRELKADWNTRFIPIVLTTSFGGAARRIEGINAGADDFLIKPYDMRELVARLHRLITTYNWCALLHPVTGLPTGQVIDRYVQEMCLHNSTRNWAMLRVDIKYFKGYNDIYGHDSGDEVLRMLRDLLLNVVRRPGGELSFVGHQRADDFVVVVPLAEVESVSLELVEKFNTYVLDCYHPEHRNSPYQVILNRRGAVQEIPRVGLTIGIVTSDLCEDISYLELWDASEAVLSKAKSMEQFGHYVNRRQLVGRAIARA